MNTGSVPSIHNSVGCGTLQRNSGTSHQRPKPTFGVSLSATFELERNGYRETVESRQALTNARMNGVDRYVQPGWLWSLSELQVWNGSAWRVCGNTGWTQNATWNNEHVPTFTWGNACGTGRWYSSWAGGEQWGYQHGWLQGWAWSPALYVPCSTCRGAVPPPPSEPPLPPGEVRTGAATTVG